MAGSSGEGSWLLALELLERGDPAFVDELRRVTEAERLASFANRWFEDARPASRRLLLEYLARPLNAYGHEPLVKRLFKRAEAAGDDALMARFLVLFDRSVRRVVRTRRDSRWERVKDVKAGRQLAARWKGEGFEAQVSSYSFGAFVHGTRTYEVIVTPRDTTMPRGRIRQARNPRTGEPIRISDLAQKLPWADRALTRGDALGEAQRKRLARYTLFSVHTRNYLRRRAWRYFRTLGRQSPERYVPAATAALLLYEDDDADDGLALIDNWGLMHLLFHHSPALEATGSGWWPAAGHSLARLEPAPYLPALWDAAPRALVELLAGARSRAVRQWAVRMVRRDSGRALRGLPWDDLVRLIAHDDEEVALLGEETLRGSSALAGLEVERWMELLRAPNPVVMESLCTLAATHVDPHRVTFEQAARLARGRPLPIARLGLDWLRAKGVPRVEERDALWDLLEAEAEPYRPELVRWLRAALTSDGGFDPAWVLAYLDHRHADVRAEGWDWFRDERRAHEDVSLWERLLESPYQDVRQALARELEAQAARAAPPSADGLPLDPARLRGLWASVLLDVHRGGRVKPGVVRQVVRRLEASPGEASLLLPLLAVALRSVRGPEWRAGLAAVVRLAGRREALATAVRRAFPELQLG